ncbi:MAG: inorganic phosphate transporter [Thermoprotei archaeon]
MSSTILASVSSFYVPYVLRANTVGLLEAMMTISPSESGLVLAAAAFLGWYLAGKIVTKTVSEGLVGIGHVASTAASLGGALMVEIMTQLAVPVSVSQIGVDAIFVPAFTRNVRISNKRNIARVVATWAIAPVLGLALASGLYLILPKGISRIRSAKYREQRFHCPAIPSLKPGQEMPPDKHMLLRGAYEGRN